MLRRNGTAGDTSMRRLAARLTGLVLLGTVAGCDRLLPFDLVSDAQVEAMGLEAWQAMLDEAPASGDPRLQAALDEVAARLLLAAGEGPGAWETRVFAGPEVNAFALPGNRIGVYEGMFGIAENADQLAAVVGHEIGHLLADHSQERMTAQIAKDFGLRFITLLLHLGDVQFASDIAAALGLGAEFGLMLPYSRQHELEADRLGLELMDAAGYDPEAAVELWRRMQAASGQRTPGFLSTHPTPDTRIDAIEEALPELEAAR
jgi:predicted Zn-dependent protease